MTTVLLAGIAIGLYVYARAVARGSEHSEACRRAANSGAIWMAVIALGYAAFVLLTQQT